LLKKYFSSIDFLSSKASIETHRVSETTRIRDHVSPLLVRVLYNIPSAIVSVAVNEFAREEDSGNC